MSIQRVCVTGAAGMTGAVTVAAMLEAGYAVVATDTVARPAAADGWDGDVRYTRADLTDYGQTVDVLDGCDAVVHLANIPAPGLVTAARTLEANTTMNGHVFLAGRQVGLQRVVWASSETTLGLDFSPANPPLYAPVDEDHFPHPTSTYALSKVLSEVQAEHVARWSGTAHVALRLSNVIPTERYATFPHDWTDPARRMFNLWSYIDVRDAAGACAAGLAADVAGARSYVIAATDSAMPTPSAELMAAHFPAVDVRGVEGNASLLSGARAQRELAFTPQHSWRDHVDGP